MRDGGKGDTPRPLGVSIEQFDNSWDRIFNKSKIESAIEETIQQHREFLEKIAEHAEECGK